MQDEYDSKKQELATIGTVLVENIINGRMIATYKLHTAITVTYNGQTYSIPCIELPSPKQGSPYESGLGNEACFIHEAACVLLYTNRVRNTHPCTHSVLFTAVCSHACGCALLISCMLVCRTR